MFYHDSRIEIYQININTKICECVICMYVTMYVIYRCNGLLPRHAQTAGLISMKFRMDVADNLD